MSFHFKPITILILTLSLCPSPLYANDIETYIVHVEAPDMRSTPQSGDLETWYRSFLPTSMKPTDTEKDRILFSYNSAFKGFAARLSREEVRAMEEKDGFISARPEMKLSLHTTHSPSFLGLHKSLGVWRDTKYGKGIIIALIDSGISPDHPSFSDEGMPPPPRKWKGTCEFNHTTCNNKIIGARNFGQEEGGSPLDDHGHGTHTASTAAGRFVEGANLHGVARGTASGVAPLAHLAIYKVCDPTCYESSIIAGIDAAIEDGVDVISISIGGPSAFFYNNGIAVAAFSAMQRGIVVSCSAGNSGPNTFSLFNEAPWVLTVGASTIDRSIRATVVLGNNETFDGQSAFQPKNFPSKKFPIAYNFTLSDLVHLNRTRGSSKKKKIDIRGQIVIFLLNFFISRYDMGLIAKNNGAAGMILFNPSPFANTTFAEVDALPTAHLSYADGEKIMAYVGQGPARATASFVFKGTVIGNDNRAPVVAFFSSRGPSGASMGILKPDILGPGVDILAAWPHSSGKKPNENPKKFNIISGTSMSCPHLSGVMALLRSLHPEWSPAAIKSAIMTTADMTNLAQDPIQNEKFLPASIFATGSGHVNPTRATDPGLVYDLHPEDYVPYLCGLNYTSRQVEIIVQHKVDCNSTKSIPDSQLNYPSFALHFMSSRPTTQTYSRTVTNVGEANSTYAVHIVPPEGVEVVVEPRKLKFAQLNQKLKYKVTFTRLKKAVDSVAYVKGYLNWNSPKHSVRSPIAVILVPDRKLG